MRSRRNFIKSCCAMGAAGAGVHLTRLGLINAYAQTTSNYRALVCVFLFGGNDSNNMIIPLDSATLQQYQAMRPGLTIGPAAALPIQGQGKAYGLHPALAGLAPLYAQRRVAAVFNVGTLNRPTTKQQLNQNPLPRNLYSHSDQTSQWQTTNVLGQGGAGWGGRAIDAIQGQNAGSFPAGVSLNGGAAFLNGQFTQPVSIQPGSTFGLDGVDTTNAAGQAKAATMQQLLTFDTGVTMIASAATIFGRAVTNAQAINDAINSGGGLQTVFPQSNLGQQLAQVARVIRARNALGMNRQVFFVGKGGFDNHSDLLTSQQNLLADVNASLTAFYQATEELGVAPNVTTFTESEFNRTGNGNSTAGTDHAWGGHHLVIGGAVNGGETYGRFPTLQLRGPDDAGDRGLWIPTTALDQYGAVLARWFGVNDANLNTVFLNLANFGATPLQGLGFLQ